MRRLAWLGVALFAACGHELDTPAPTVASIKPNLVCAEQITKAVVVAGSNLTPLPTRTLGVEVVNLPTVTLTQSQGLDGNPAAGAPHTIVDDPAHPGASHLRWESEEQLTFDVTPDLQLTPGLYDLTVANPDGQAASLPQALAVLPPPTVTSVMPMAVCDAQADQVIMVDGQNFLEVDAALPTVDILDGSGAVVYSSGALILEGCVAVGARTPTLQLCTSMTLTIPKGTLAPGTYQLRVTNPADAECQSTEVVTFVVEPPPKIDAVIPTRICAGGGTLGLTGSGFLTGAQVTLFDPANMMSTPASSSNVAGDGMASATFGAINGMAGDTLDVTLQNADGCVDTLVGMVKVVPGPIIFYVDPPFVYGGVTTPATIYTTGIAGPLPATGAVVLTPHGMTTGMIDLSSASHIDPAHPKHVIVDVPPTVPAGSYDLMLTDASACPALYANAITVVTQKTTLKDITPPFGYDLSTTAVTIDATAALFLDGARAYLAKHGGGGIAVPLSAVTLQSATTLTAVVPALGVANDGLYDLVVVNPDGTIGFLDSAFTVEPLPVPVITSISPGGVTANCAGTACDVVIKGANFATMAGSTPAPVTLDCVIPGTGTHVTYTPTYDAGTAGSVMITIAAGSIPAGNVCVPTVNNGTATNKLFVTSGTIAILQASFNINTVSAGAPLNVARRAPAVALDGPTSAARYLYAIGGDTGALNGANLPSAPLGSIEFALQDPATGEKPWALLPAQSDLPAGGVTHAQVAPVGRFLWLVGGYGGAVAGSLDTVSRSVVLDPAEAPQISDADLTPDATNGLDPGLYLYRVAAVLKATDPVNPGGETLAGDPFAIKVPSFNNQKFQVKIVWSGGPVNVDHWRIYRLPSGVGAQSVVFTTANAASTSFTDSGPTLTPFVAGKPLPFGALGTWAPMPSMNVHRAGAGVALIVDQTPGVNRAYLYAGFGFDSTAAGAAQFPASYEYLVINTSTGAAIGTWVAAAPITNGVTADTGRWLGGAYAVTSDVDSNACPTTGACQEYLFFGAGAANVASQASGAAAVGSSDVALVAQGATGGALTFGVAQAANKDYGYGAVTATNFLFAIGGGSNGGVTPKLNADAIVKPLNATTTPTLAQMTWSPQGSGALPAPGLFLPGVVFGTPFFYTVGGTTSIGGAAVNTTYFNLF